MKVLLRKCYRGHSNLFEWSCNGKTWYPINYRKIVPQHNGDADPFRALEPYRKAMNKMLKYPGFLISVFEGSYDKEKKVLKVSKHA
jgi:hypothetical protein